MLEVYDKGRKKIAILQNAFAITATEKINAVDFLSFSLPLNDDKAKHCRPFNLVKQKNQFYRIIQVDYEKSGSGTTTYGCEHVIATLMDNVLFGYHVVGNLGFYTSDVIRYVLSHQAEQNWVLKRCDFVRQFEYGWEQENLLAALFSIPNRFTEKYIWRFDTSAYPWQISLMKLEENAPPEFYIRAHKNMLSIVKQSDLKNICTRLYPLGAGEGVNQLNIKSINAGVPYLQSPPEYISQHGLVERVWIDRRYEDKESLKAAAQVMLNELQEPYVEYQIDIAELNGGSLDTPEVGKIAEIIDIDTNTKHKTYITEVSGDVQSNNCKINIANRPQDIASTVADLADRQRIEMTYSQGATQIYAQSIQANSDASNGTVLNFFIPEDMRIINKIIAKIRVSRFRAYSRATLGGGGTSTTSSSGGGGAATSSNGGGGNTTSGASSSSTTLSGRVETSSSLVSVGSATSNTAAANGSGSHRHSYTVHILDHSHMATSHTHGMSHTHSVKLSSHSHSVNLPTHSHSLNIPDHTHTIQPGIYLFGNPTRFDVYTNGQKKTSVDTASADIDLTSALLNEQGLIPRGSWNRVEVRANDLAYITIDMFVQGFIQSRGDTTV